jgi:hypothetical protein
MPCRAPSTVAVYGIHFCTRHGAEVAQGAREEMYQDAAERLEHATEPYAPNMNPALREVFLRGRGEMYAIAREEDKEEEALTGAFPFRADRLDREVVSEIADPTPGQPHLVERWRDVRREIHRAMRCAYETDVRYLVESLLTAREEISEQLAYAIALTRMDHPDILERAHEENLEDARTFWRPERLRQLTRCGAEGETETPA